MKTKRTKSTGKNDPPHCTRMTDFSGASDMKVQNVWMADRWPVLPDTRSLPSHSKSTGGKGGRRAKTSGDQVWVEGTTCRLSLNRLRKTHGDGTYLPSWGLKERVKSLKQSRPEEKSQQNWNQHQCLWLIIQWPLLRYLITRRGTLGQKSNFNNLSA